MPQLVPLYAVHAPLAAGSVGNPGCSILPTMPLSLSQSASARRRRGCQALIKRARGMSAQAEPGNQLLGTANSYLYLYRFTSKLLKLYTINGTGRYGR